MIDERVDKMFAAGLLEETELLLGKNPDRTAMQAIGYKELAMCLSKEIDKEGAIRLIKRNSRRYAKRQFTWFRKEENITWIDVTGIFDSSGVFHAIKDLLSRISQDIFSCNTSGR